jgi:hypothetical protein
MATSEVVIIPPELNLRDICKFSSEISMLPKADEFIFDFGKVGWFSPFAMLYLLMTLNEFKRQRPNAKRKAENYRRHKYAAHMGFFKSFGLDFGLRPGEAAGSNTYIPITIFSVKDLIDRANETYQQVGDIIEGRSQEIATLLCQMDSGDLVDTIAFSVREIIRNIVEHSDASEIFMVGQYWPAKGTVEVAIADAGIGIKRSLNRNPKTAVGSDEEANKVALLPGVSGNVNAGKGAQYDHWQNSGYGLYMAHRLCGLGGKFSIVSGDNGLSIVDGLRVVDSAHFTGTAVRLCINTKTLYNLNERLSEFRNDGAKIAKYLKRAGKSGPSVASQMLARDFRISEI